MYLKTLKICPFSLIFTYTSYSLNLLDLTSGNPLEFLNLFNIIDLTVRLPAYDLKQTLPLKEALKHMLQYYKEDMVSNQKINFVKAIGPIRSMFSIGNAVVNVVRKPYEGWHSDKGIGRGLAEGM